MCLLMAAHARHADYRLIVAANRDEYYARPAAPAAYWNDNAWILGGRDEQGGGTWLAVNQTGAFAAITNVRISEKVDQPRSRGLIVNDYLTGVLPARVFVDSLAKEKDSYDGFNVLASDATSLVWYSNMLEQATALSPGVYGLSNHLLDTPWPKVTQIKADFHDAQSLSQTALIEALFASLANEEIAPDKDLPDTGISLGFERVLAPIFIAGESYGTRCSTIILISYSGELTFIERRFGPRKSFLGESSFKFELRSGPT
jgi:uncharacterized protein with NRDE domain